MDWAKVGVVTHYYDRIGVAVVELIDSLAVGDWLAFARGEELLFEQEAASMQIEHQNISSAAAGESIGLKVDYPVKPGVDVYKRLA